MSEAHATEQVQRRTLLTVLVLNLLRNHATEQIARIVPALREVRA